MTDILDRIPYAAFLGLTHHVSGDELTVTMPFSDHLIGNPMLPALHGGSTAALLELTAMAQARLRFPDGAPRLGGPHVINPENQGGDGAELAQGHPDGQAADMIQQGRDQSSRQHPGVGIAHQIRPIGTAHDHAICFQGLEGETQGVGVRGAGRQLRQDVLQERRGHSRVIAGVDAPRKSPLAD